MPQLSLYVDEHTLERLRRAAKLERVSVSKYVVDKLNRIIRTEWPKNYGRLFGAIDDESFRIERSQGFQDDMHRERM